MDGKILLLPGDGIGVEVTDQALKILTAISKKHNRSFTIDKDIVGGAAIDKYGKPLKSDTLNKALHSDAILFGAVGGPKWDDPTIDMRPEDSILTLRKELGLFANIRPIRIYDSLIDKSVIKPEILANVDFIVIRELTGGLYFAKPKRRYTTKTGEKGVDTLRYSEQEIQRVVTLAFELAQSRKKKLTSVDKANVLQTSRLWRDVVKKVAENYPDVALEHILVDACAMELIQKPSKFDVIVAENMFGDILTDEASVLSASMGMLPSVSVKEIPIEGRTTLGLYEPIHGTAPDIAGKGIANPIAAILSTAFLLRYSLGLTEEAAAVELAVNKVLESGLRTTDIARDNEQVITTEQMGNEIASLI